MGIGSGRASRSDRGGRGVGGLGRARGCGGRGGGGGRGTWDPGTRAGVALGLALLFLLLLLLVEGARGIGVAVRGDIGSDASIDNRCKHLIDEGK